jgi:hypothetical protein
VLTFFDFCVNILLRTPFVNCRDRKGGLLLEVSLEERLAEQLKKLQAFMLLLEEIWGSETAGDHVHE